VRLECCQTVSSTYKNLQMRSRLKYFDTKRNYTQLKHVKVITMTQMYKIGSAAVKFKSKLPTM
jgi:hypothetical protein